MKIGLITENSQANKNQIIYDELKKVITDKNHEIINFGMFDEDDQHLTYVEIGLMASVLLETKAVDFVVTGCGTGQGSTLACNAFPGVTCGHLTNPVDAYLFSQVNGGNAVALPYAQNFGWGGEINLGYIFERLFQEEIGGGYPKERREAEQQNAKILKGVKEVTHQDLLTILQTIDRDFLLETLNRKSFKDYFFQHGKQDEVYVFLKDVLI